MASHDFPSDYVVPPLQPSLYNLSPEELQFFKSQTGIEDEDALRDHIMAVQAKAYKHYPYPCIRRFAFTNMKISRLPAYPHVLDLAKSRKDAILLDLGCCFGNDARKAVADGFPIQNVIASDLRPEYYEYGLELFRSTRETFPLHFIAGDAFDPAFLDPAPPCYELPDGPAPPLSSLTTLTPLRCRISAIHASSFFHLFDEDQQLQMARRVASLLSPLPGSVIFGMHVARPEKGYREVLNHRGGHMFCNSPESWKELWDGTVFEKGTVKVDTELTEAERDAGQKVFILQWSVTRV
ncbi:hypothetical protein PLICRDRAFT_159089 [Plicaturopsis crispa FD-325 SS-3]|nr:hypothetical protein PLICRDRAFT_159089 [Plicaturopsis crispa FD-325 SS-3]